MYLIYNFTNAIELADRLAALSRYTARLYELLDYLTPAQQPVPSPAARRSVNNGEYSPVGSGDPDSPESDAEAEAETGLGLLEGKPGIFVKNLTILLPSRETLLKGSFSLSFFVS